MTVHHGFPIITTDLYGQLNSTSTEIDNMCDKSARVQAGGSSITLTAEDDERITLLDTAAGTTVTLPAASGSGVKFRFVISTVATTNSHIVKVANASDTMIGIILSLDDTGANAVGFAAAATSDTITLNRSTTGSVSKGEYIEVEDIAANVWFVNGVISNTGTPATPFSATV